MGVHGYWFAHFAVGRAETVRALVRTHPSRVDEHSVVALESADGRQAVVSTSTGVTNFGLATVVGTAGAARFVWPFVFPSSFVADVASGSQRWDDTTELVLRKGLGWQTCAIAGFVADGLTDSPAHSLADAVDVLRVIAAVRSQAGSVRP